MKTPLLIGIVLTAVSFNTMAMRCDGQITDDNDNAQSVIAKCGQPDSYSQNAWGDTQELTYKKDGTSVTITIQNGHLSNEDQSNF